jgi:hypothetical protein
MDERFFCPLVRSSHEQEWLSKGLWKLADCVLSATVSMLTLLNRMENAPIVLVYRQPSSRRKVFIHVKWDSMDKRVNQAQVYLKQYKEGEFHDVETCHFRWKDSQQESLSSIPITRNDTRMFYLSGLREDSKNPLYCFLVKYKLDNIEHSFSQYFTICGRAANENALLRVLNVMKTYPQDSEIVQVLNLFQSVYDQIRMNSSGNSVGNGANKRKTIKNITEVSSAKKSKTESVVSVSGPMNQGLHHIQNSHMCFYLPPAVPIINPFDPMFPFIWYGQLSMPSCPYYALPIQQESASESISADLPNGLTMHRSFFTQEKKPNVSTVVENKANVEEEVLDFEQFLDFDDTLDSITSNPVFTESEDINKDEHSSTSELITPDFSLTNSEISTKIAELLMLNKL